MPRKYLRKQLEVRASDDLLYVYNLNGDLVCTYCRSHTPKDWVVIPEDMPKEYAPDEWGKQLSEQPDCFGKLDGIRRRLTDGFTVYIEKA